MLGKDVVELLWKNSGVDIESFKDSVAVLIDITEKNEAKILKKRDDKISALQFELAYVKENINHTSTWR